MAVKPTEEAREVLKVVPCSFVKTILSKALEALTEFETIVLKLNHFIILCSDQRLTFVAAAENDALLLEMSPPKSSWISATTENI
jgi:hypothetical protein